MKTIVICVLVITFGLTVHAENTKTLPFLKENTVKIEKERNARIYTWEIKTINGNAKGVSLSEMHARKMIATFTNGDIAEYIIITSKPLR